MKYWATTPGELQPYEQRGYSDLVGKSLLDCHNPESREKIKEIHTRLLAGESEVFLGVSKGEKVTVIAVPAPGSSAFAGEIIGYYERFEKMQSSEE
jgi:hypothetical protein